MTHSQSFDIIHGNFIFPTCLIGNYACPALSNVLECLELRLDAEGLIRLISDITGDRYNRATVNFKLEVDYARVVWSVCVSISNLPKWDAYTLECR
jgi:hypothetical protein